MVDISMFWKTWRNGLYMSKSRHKIKDFLTVGCGLIVDLDYQIVYVNKEFTRLFGYKMMEIIGKHINILLPEHLRERHQGHLSRHNKELHMENMFMSYKENLFGRTKDGKIFKINVILNTINLNKKCYILLLIHPLTGENTLLEQFRQFKLFFTMSVDLMCMANKAGYFINVNKAFQETLGYTEKELLHIPFIELVYEEDKQDTQDVYQKMIIQNESILSFVNRYITKEGKIVWLSWNAFIYDDKIFANCRDITTMKSIESILNTVDISIIIVDQHFLYKYMNRSFESRFDKIIRGVSMYDLIRDREIMKELELFYQDVTKVWKRELFLNEGVYLLTMIKEGTNIVCLLMDISMEYKKDIDIHKKDIIWEECEKMIKIGSWEWKIGTNDLYWTEGLYRMFEIDKEDLTYENYLKVIHIDDVEMLQEMIQKSISMGTEYYIKHRIIVPKSGKLKYIEAYGRVIQNTFLIGVCQDVTEFKKNEHNLLETRRQLEEALHTKSIFVANMSHEIRSPLNGIIGMVTLLRDTSLDQKQRGYVDTIVKASGILMYVVHNILDFSKIELGTLEVTLEAIDVREFFKFFKVYYEPVIYPKGLKFNLTIDENVPIYVKLDKIKLQQILSNLMSNAIKFTEKGHITILVEYILEMLTVHIIDSGIGISKENLTKLFQPFTQIDASNTREYGGTGLGLTICKKLVELMNGQIMVQSSEALGTKVTFKLPVEIVETIEESVENTVGYTLDPVLSVNKHLIVLVEDSQVNQFLFQKFLDKLGYNHLVLFNNGQECVDRIQNYVPDIIFMDLHMPIMDGFTATRKLREMGFICPIIALTANVMLGIEKDCLDSGMNDYMVKPLNLDVLSDMITKWLKK